MTNLNIRTRGVHQRPSELMLQWLETEGSRNWMPLLDALLTGTHVNNPYHNTTHMLNMAWYARHMYRSEAPARDWLPRDEAIVVVSALLHDYDHSGGYFKNDLDNINAALNFIDSVVGRSLLCESGFEYHIPEIKQNILHTRYDAATKSFPHEPSNLMQKSLRDADLMSLYSSEGRQLLVGLYYEIYGVPFIYASLDEAKAYARAQYDFNSNARMYTDYGRRMQAQQFVRCMRDLLATLGREHYQLAITKVSDVVPEVALLVPDAPDSVGDSYGTFSSPTGPTLQ
jgi:hypothetical protein